MKSAFTFVFLLAAVVGAQEMPMVGGRDMRPGFSIEQIWLKPAPGPDGKDIAVQDGRLSVSLPLWKNDRFSTAFYANLHRLALTEPVAIPVRSFVSPTEIGTLDTGFAFKDNQFQKGSLSVSLGTSSSGEFSSIGSEHHAFGANVAYEVKVDDTDSWIYFLSYSQNRAILNGLPVPGLAYSFKRDRLTGLLGLPFAFLLWRPNDSLFVTTFLSPFAASAEIAHMTYVPLMTFAGVSWLPRSYQNVYTDGAKDDQFMYERKQLTAGLRLALGPQNSASIAYVRAFDRRFIIGKSIIDKKADAVGLDGADGIELKLKLTF